jgi:hypothetical protein
VDLGESCADVGHHGRSKVFRCSKS